MSIGHGVLAKLRTPFRGITTEVLVVPVGSEVPIDAVDAIAAAGVSPAPRPRRLPHLPLAGLPGWDGERLGDRWLDDASVFRAARATLAGP